MSRTARARLEHFGSWWVLLTAACSAAGAGLFLLTQLSGLQDASPTVADAASLRPSILHVAGAADEAAATGDERVLEEALEDLESRRAALTLPVAELLGVPQARASLDALDASLDELATAARAYAAGEAGAGAGGDAFAAAASEIDLLIEQLAAESSASTGAVRSRAFTAVVVLTFAAALAVAAFGYARHRILTLRRRELALAQRPDELTSDLPVMLYQAEPNGELVVVSGSTSMLLGRTRGELTGRALSECTTDPPTFAERIAPGDVGATMRDVASFEAEWRHADGSLRLLHTMARAIRDDDGRLIAIRGLVRDLSEQQAAERALRESEERFRTVLETAQNGMMIVNAEGEIELSNGALCDLLGYGPDELRKRSVSDIVDPNSERGVVELIAAPIWSGEPRSRRQERFVRRDGQVLDVDLSISPFRERGRVVGVLVEARDITESKRAEETIQRLAYVDELTGLPNRSAFSRELARALDEAREREATLAVMLFDLDQFKLINDTLGHHAGDQVLRAVAERLQQRLPSRHTLARLGGDEFMLLADVGHIAAAESLAGEVLDALSKPFPYEGQELHVAASIGVSVFPRDGSDAETLVRRADSAMYQAKSHGRNTYQTYSQAMELAAHGRFNLHSGIRRALAEGEFVLHYQPLIDAREGRIVGAEALVRWQHPERGLVYPDEFIPILEDTGLIVPVGEWVIREACSDAKRWADADLEGSLVSVNLSARQVLQPDLVPLMERVLAESGLSPDRLSLELTETAVLQNMDAAVRVLSDLRGLGIEAVLDDFGTGHSSLSHLRQLPVRGVKIDRSFVSDVPRSDEARTIVSGVVALGHALNLTIAAEGVETEPQSRFLRSLDCDVLQGFLFGRPQPAEEFEGLLNDQAAAGGQAA